MVNFSLRNQHDKGEENIDSMQWQKGFKWGRFTWANPWLNGQITCIIFVMLQAGDLCQYITKQLNESVFIRHHDQNGYLSINKIFKITGQMFLAKYVQRII